MFKLSKLPKKYLDVIETIFSDVEGAIVIDENGIVLIFTDHYARETGFKKESVVGKRIDEVFPTTRMLEVLKTKKPILADIWQLHGKTQIVNRIPITVDGEIIGALGINVFRYIDDAKGFAKRLAHLSLELDYYKEEVKRLSAAKYSLNSIIGNSEGIQEAKMRVRIAAPSTSPILITGETGTGKELFAHAVHQESSRRDLPFIRVNCATIPYNLIESELFGYEEGAFTGAKKSGKPGKFELANRGSIFLDEISELSAPAQAQLLRVLQEKEIDRIGGTSSISVDVRVISATNRSLPELVKEGKFRSDLLFRLDVFPISIPPLRERIIDIEPLCEHFIKQYNSENGTEIIGLSSEALEALYDYHWPGNVRELYNIIERSCIDARQGEISIDNLLRFAERFESRNNIKAYRGFDIEKAKMEAEKATIIRALKKMHNNRTKAAGLLGISRSALYYKINQYNILLEE
ncbi:MAG TPA: sigma 54-interacting transcriptional regulator [Syntrophomonadaceae bacterium]|nr:sigma 54-interacting transcriptional regulator [Syntrophomonadaceae bacterium]HNX29216.1 sigma 54-interacting transcriptional regulator [Syntrophomonadaceae bacterium]HPR92584.1 sigma 54-interacting transcriptional regulator [Syntrophomonadaceae bacterium]